jgi:2-oxoglutarate/2-oxoacid ferredoxin oxidoreductase subunit beta
MSDAKTLTKKDFKPDQDVKWCPGCGDYAILNAVQAACASIGTAKEDVVFVSGIGCSSRFPYYMDTYGFHTIHGRAPAFATGIKASNPDLTVWLVTGDGDGLSIGGNHLAHLLRRNVNINVLLFNNEIYGLTKGQYSPTSPRGLRTKTSPMGSVDRPFNPISFALGCNATFVARTIDTHMKHMTRTLEEAAAHEGTSFVEIYQNCVIFNDGAFDDVADKAVRDDKTVDLRAGEKLVFGKEMDKGIAMKGFEPHLVSADDADVWDPTRESSAASFLMSSLDHEPGMPNPIGVFRSVPATTFDSDMSAQLATAVEQKGEGQIKDLIYAGETWEVS